MPNSFSLTHKGNRPLLFGTSVKASVLICDQNLGVGCKIDARHVTALKAITIRMFTCTDVIHYVPKLCTNVSQQHTTGAWVRKKSIICFIGSKFNWILYCKLHTLGAFIFDFINFHKI